MLNIEMHDPEGKIMEELRDSRIPQSSVAITYAFLMAQEEGKHANWPAINTAIRLRWGGKTALGRVKAMAWKHVDEWTRRGREDVEMKV